MSIIVERSSFDAWCRFWTFLRENAKNLTVLTQRPDLKHTKNRQNAFDFFKCKKWIFGYPNYKFGYSGAPSLGQIVKKSPIFVR